MEIFGWLTEMGLEDSALVNEYQMDYSDELSLEHLAAAFGNDTQQTNSSFANIDLSPWELEATQTCFETPTKQLKTTSGGTESAFTSEKVSPPAMLSFGNSSSPTHDQQSYDTSSVAKEKSMHLNQNYARKSGKGNKRACAPSTNIARNDHIIAERKRREKLSLHFIALSAIVPGLKKMDKATILGDATKYLKELQERVKMLEDQMESVAIVRKMQIPPDNNFSSICSDFSHESLPEIQAIVSDKNVLIKIHCKQQKGVVAKVLSEIEKLNLGVKDSSVMPFGTCTLDITVVAQMDAEFDIQVENLVKCLRFAFRQFI